MATTVAAPVTRSRPEVETVRSSPLADPAPWAVTAFVTTSFMLGWYNAGEIGHASLPVFLPVAFFFGGLMQILVAILEVGRGNTFGAVVFGTYGIGLIWIGLGLLAWGFSGGHPSLIKAGGRVTVAFAILAWYHAAADIVNLTFRRRLLPLGRLDP